jgi:hypothetical protein
MVKIMSLNTYGIERVCLGRDTFLIHVRKIGDVAAFFDDYCLGTALANLPMRGSALFVS